MCTHWSDSRGEVCGSRPKTPKEDLELRVFWPSISLLFCTHGSLPNVLTANHSDMLCSRNKNLLNIYYILDTLLGDARTEESKRYGQKQARKEAKTPCEVYILVVEDRL